MSLLQLPDSLQIWDNAAFEDGGSASKISSAPAPPPPLQEVSTNASGPQDLDPCKENRGPEAIEPLLDDALPKKAASRVAFAEVEEIQLDDEIVRIEEVIARLSSRLEALRAKKADRDARGRPRGRIVPAKFMDPCTPASKRMDREMEVTPASARNRRRGVSLGPLEILATPARSMNPRPSPAKNLWPSALKKKTEEPIAKADRKGNSFKLIQLGKANGTPTRPVHDYKINANPKSQQPTTARKMAPDAKKTVETPGNPSNRRRAVSLGPAEIVVASAWSRRQNNPQEHTEKAVKLDNQPNRSSSIGLASPKPSVSAKKAVTMGAADKAAKEGQFHGRIRPQALFQDNKNSASCKRPSKAAAKARVVPSRYNSAGTGTTSEKQGNKRGKWSLPELSRGATGVPVTGSSSRLTPANKRRQGSELEDQMLDDLDVVATSPRSSIMKLAATLPKIKTLRCNAESPRDSGCAKRASELVGREPFFSASEDEVLNSPCLALTFLEDLPAVQQP